MHTPAVLGISVGIKYDQRSGYALLTHDGVTGYFCDDYWLDNEAKVFCRQMGLVDGRVG